MLNVSQKLAELKEKGLKELVRSKKKLRKPKGFPHYKIQPSQPILAVQKESELKGYSGTS
jgi:hypothetical protein